MTTTEHLPPTYPAEALAGRLLEATVGTVEIFSVYVGEQLGLYKALKTGGNLTPAGTTGHGGLHPRRQSWRRCR